MSLDAGIAVKVPPPAQTDGEEYYGETLATLPASLTLSASLGASATVDETTTEEPTSAETTEAPADQTTAAETLAGSMGLPEPTEASVEASASASLDPTPLASENMENSTEETPTRTVSRTAAPATCTGLACPGDCNESKCLKSALMTATATATASNSAAPSGIGTSAGLMYNCSVFTSCVETTCSNGEPFGHDLAVFWRDTCGNVIDPARLRPYPTSASTTMLQTPSSSFAPTRSSAAASMTKTAIRVSMTRSETMLTVTAEPTIFYASTEDGLAPGGIAGIVIGILLATLVASLLIYFFVFRKNSPLTLSRAKVVPTAQPPDKALEPEAPHQETKNKGLQSQPEILSTASYESSEYTDSSDSGSSYTSTSDDDEPPVPVLATLAPHPSIRRPPQAAAPTPDPRGIMDNSRTPQMPPQGKAPFDRAATAVHLNSMRLSEMEQRRQREIAQRAEEANRRGPGQNVAFAADRRQASFTLGRAPMRLSEASYGGHPAMLGMEGLPRPNSWFGPVAPASSASMLPSPSIISDYQPNGPSTFADAYNLPSLTSNFGAGYGAPQPTHAGFGYGHGVPPPGPNLGHTYLQMDDLSSPGIVDMYGEERAPVIEAPIVLAGPSLHAASTAPSVASLSYSPMHMAQAMKDYVFGGTHDRFSPEYSVARYATPSVQSEQFR